MSKKVTNSEAIEGMFQEAGFTFGLDSSGQMLLNGKPFDWIERARFRVFLRENNIHMAAAKDVAVAVAHEGGAR